MKKENNKEVIVKRCNYCIHNKGKNERFGFMWYCDVMKRYLPQGYKFCYAERESKGYFEIDKVKYKQYKNVMK